MSTTQDMNARHFFEVYGPFQLPRRNGLIIKPTADWWSETVNVYHGPSPERGIGCYMFTLGSKRIKPWYIGQTVCAGGFRDEAFTDHKLDHYNAAFAGRNGPPAIFFFPLITRDFYNEGWRLSKDRTRRVRKLVDWLERTLIGMALAQNNDLRNKKDATYLRTVRVRGILGKAPVGRPNEEVALARRALFGDD